MGRGPFSCWTKKQCLPHERWVASPCVSQTACADASRSSPASLPTGWVWGDAPSGECEIGSPGQRAQLYMGTIAAHSHRLWPGNVIEGVVGLPAQQLWPRQTDVSWILSRHGHEWQSFASSGHITPRMTLVGGPLTARMASRFIRRRRGEPITRFGGGNARGCRTSIQNGPFKRTSSAPCDVMDALCGERWWRAGLVQVLQMATCRLQTGFLLVANTGKVNSPTVWTDSDIGVG